MAGIETVAAGAVGIAAAIFNGGRRPRRALAAIGFFGETALVIDCSFEALRRAERASSGLQCAAV